MRTSPTSIAVPTDVGGRRSSARTSRRQLGEVERLGEVVVGTRIEPAHGVDDLVHGGEHQHGRHVALDAHLPAHVGAVTVRQPQVEHDRVVRDGTDGVPGVEHAVATRSTA